MWFRLLQLLQWNIRYIRFISSGTSICCPIYASIWSSVCVSFSRFCLHLTKGLSVRMVMMNGRLCYCRKFRLWKSSSLPPTHEPLTPFARSWPAGFLLPLFIDNEAHYNAWLIIQFTRLHHLALSSIYKLISQWIISIRTTITSLSACSAKANSSVLQPLSSQSAWGALSSALLWACPFLEAWLISSIAARPLHRGEGSRWLRHVAPCPKS